MNRVVVTGMGIITAIGRDVAENYDSLLNSKAGVAPITILDTIHKDFLAGEVKLSNDELGSMSGIEDAGTYTRTTLLALIAAKQAFDAGISRYGADNSS